MRLRRLRRAPYPVRTGAGRHCECPTESVNRCQFDFPVRSWVAVSKAEAKCSGRVDPTQVEGSSRLPRLDVFQRPRESFADSTGVAQERAGTRVVNLAVLQSA